MAVSYPLCCGVAGVVGAVGNNNLGVTGVNQAISIIACQFMDATGNGWVSDAIQCIDYCISKDAHIMSNSWGGVAYSQALQVPHAFPRQCRAFLGTSGPKSQNCLGGLGVSKAFGG